MKSSKEAKSTSLHPNPSPSSRPFPTMGEGDHERDYAKGEGDHTEGNLLPQDYSWGRMIVIGLGVLGIGLAIAFVGLVLLAR